MAGRQLGGDRRGEVFVMAAGGKDAAGHQEKMAGYQEAAAAGARKEATSLAVPMGMVLAQVLTTGMVLVSKMALNAGMFPFVLIVYRTLIGTAVVAPFAFFFERDMIRNVNLKVLVSIFINAALGVPLAMGLCYYGMRDTDAAYAVNFLNLTPIVTFVIAVILRAEKLAFKNWPSAVKLVSTFVCVGGTMVVSLYKGKLLNLWHAHLLKSQITNAGANPHHNMVIGSLFLCGSCLSYSLWYIAQARLARMFPSKYVSTTLTCLLGSLQSIVVGLLITSDKSAWILKWDVQLLAVVFSGVFSSGATYVLNMWAIARRGPIYPTMFSSLSLIMTTILDSVLLGTSIYLGSVLGTVMIILGLYAFLWGQGKELAAAKLAGQNQNQLILERITSTSY